MYTIFHKGEIWAQYEGLVTTDRRDIPVYAMCYDDVAKQWWCWYYSWNKLNPDFEDLPPVCQTFLLLLGETT